MFPRRFFIAFCVCFRPLPSSLCPFCHFHWFPEQMLSTPCRAQRFRPLRLILVASLCFFIAFCLCFQPLPSFLCPPCLLPCPLLMVSGPPVWTSCLGLLSGHLSGPLSSLWASGPCLGLFLYVCMCVMYVCYVCMLCMYVMYVCYVCMLCMYVCTNLHT